MTPRFPPAMNPILLKELRQAVRSRFVSGAYCLFLLVLVIIVGVTLLSQLTVMHHHPAGLAGIGKGLFHALLVPLTLVCLLFVPAYTGFRLAAERSEAHLDLQFVTRLSPGAILRGKFFAGMTLVILMTSAAMPFLTLTFRLGGVDLPSVLLVLVFLVMVSALAIVLALVLAALPVNRFWRVVLALVGLQALFGILMSINAMAAGLIISGAGSRMMTTDFWKTTFLVGLGAVITGGLAFSVAVALISPVTANRALPVRAWATGSWLAWGLAIGLIARIGRNADLLMLWTIPAMLFAIIALVVTTGEGVEFSRRVRQSIPRRRALRWLVFPFYSGAAPGTLWALLLGLATLALTVLLAWWIEAPAGRRVRILPSSAREVLDVMAGMLAYAFAYSQSALLLWRAIMRRWLPRHHVPALALLLLTIGCVLPLLVGAGARQALRHDGFGAWTVGNPFALFSDRYRTTGQAFALVWAGILLVPQIPWILRTLATFRPSDAKRPDTM